MMAEEAQVPQAPQGKEPVATNGAAAPTQEAKQSPGKDVVAAGSDNEVHGSDNEANGDVVDVDEATKGVEDMNLDAEDKPKKKKKKKSKKTGKSRRHITGFEEFYADVPMTPAQALENKQLYNPARAFTDRIEECIQRWRARRKLDMEQMQMFSKYLFLGGIDDKPRQFTGVALDQDTINEADKDEIRQMTATDFVGGAGMRFYDPSDKENWVVDFEGIVKGFLSRSIADIYLYDLTAIEKASNLIKNFLNYVLMHDACPEYTHDIMAARKICEIAPIELRYCHELFLELPGSFNLAARTLFLDNQVNDLEKTENLDAAFLFRLTVLYYNASNEQATKELLKTEATTIRIIGTKTQAYRVIEVERPRRKAIKHLREQLVSSGETRSAKPAGVFKAIPTVIYHGWGNNPQADEVDNSDDPEEEFIVEDELLAKMEVGMKLEMTVCELSIGVRFIKEVHDVRPSFDLFLPQHLMRDFKVPVPNDRPAPTEDDPYVEERSQGPQPVLED
ncbi:Argonaute siRNA chaperone complex subunit Arb1-domain-containing protein [Xylariomycetidae sp. FL0641]|nr:Argonaute siRNA chaperone complex subunit Arb1-domain-containing protein [Xylariomycetidae sp. FL0641]